jgi:hypothetical protein
MSGGACTTNARSVSRRPTCRACRGRFGSNPALAHAPLDLTSASPCLHEAGHRHPRADEAGEASAASSAVMKERSRRSKPGAPCLPARPPPSGRAFDLPGPCGERSQAASATRHTGCGQREDSERAGLFHQGRCSGTRGAVQPPAPGTTKRANPTSRFAARCRLARVWTCAPRWSELDLRSNSSQRPFCSLVTARRHLAAPPLAAILGGLLKSLASTRAARLLRVNVPNLSGPPPPLYYVCDFVSIP